MWKENRLNRIDSTQKEAIRKIKERKLLEPEFFFSFEQFDGYGTHGKKWEKCKHSLAISFVWPKRLTPVLETKVLPMVVSMKIIKGLEKFSNLPDYTLGLKWPNDLIKDEKKIGGVLVQTINHDGEEWIIVGIGVNLIWDLPPSNAYFGSLLKKNEEHFSKEHMVSIISQNMKEVFNLIEIDNIINEFNNRDIFKGKFVTLKIKNAEYTGKNCGITKNGGICLEDKKGKIQVFQTGSIELL